MPSPRLTGIVAVALAATVIGACGSASNHVSAPAPAPRKLALVTSGGRADAAIYPQRPTVYVLDGTLPDLGTQAPVRRLVSHEVTDADVARIAGALGMHASPEKTGTGYEVHDGDAVLTVDTTGGVTYVSYSSAGGAGGISVGRHRGLGLGEHLHGRGGPAARCRHPGYGTADGRSAAARRRHARDRAVDHDPQPGRCSQCG